MAKSRTLDQIERMKAKAARFVENVLDDSDRADEIDDESPEEYAERKHIRILDNPRERRRTVPTNKELQERISELEDENDELSDRLDDIVGLAGGDDEDEEEIDDGEGEDLGEAD